MTDTARDVIAESLHNHGIAFPTPDEAAAWIEKQLRAHGYRILAPGYLEKIERALTKAEESAATLPARESVKLVPAHWHALAAAIREMKHRD